MNRLLDRPVPATPSRPAPAPDGPERQLMDAVGRLARGEAWSGWLLVAVHLSRLPPPGPLAFHARVAAAALERAGDGAEGRLFTFRNGDLALLFRPRDEGRALLALLAELFGPAHDSWPLPAAAERAAAFLETLPPARAAAPAARRQPPETPAPGPARQVAIHFRPDLAQPLYPLFRELTAAPSRAIEAAWAGLAPPDGPPSLPLHLNMTVGGILSEDFAQLLDAGRDRGCGAMLAAEVSLPDALADPHGLLLARERLRLAGAGFVLDGVEPGLLPLIRPEVLEPRFIKLGWQPGLPETDLAAEIGRIGTERLVLTGCDAEAALRWGRLHGIARFQGPFIDGALAATQRRAPRP